VRITVQGNKEAEACGKIRDKLFQQGCVPQQCSFS
jgi:4-hydroxy-3-methylbut-2-en-1-yl diphosphate synthase IspG/GcpE